MAGTIIANCPSGNNFTLEINFNATQANPAGYNVLVDGVTQAGSPFSYNGTGPQTATIPLSGDGQAHTIEVIDVNDPTCVLSTNLTAPDCGAAPSCSISMNATQTGGCNAVNDVNVEVTLTSINGGAAGFNLTVDGSPGGIGMAGTITAVEDCDDGALNMQFAFDMENGGFSGYEVYLDGNLENTFAYVANNPQSFDLTLPADGQMVNLMIQDVEDNTCLLDTTFQMPNCADPCFGFVAAFESEIDHQTLAVDFTSLTENATSWLWTFGNGDASVMENPSYTYAENGTYEVCLTVQNADLGCEDQICEQITVGQYLCEANFSVEIDGLTVSITDESITTEDIDQWTYDMGNMNWIVGQQNPVYTYDTLGIYTICLMIEAGACEADTCMTIDLSDECLAFQPGFDFVVDNDNLTVQFLDETTGDPNQWLWGFGDANTSNSQNPEHTYDQMGNYNVCLLVQNTDLGCNESFCQSIQVGTVSTIDLDIRNFALKIYPNPAPQDNLTWTLEGVLERDYHKELALKMYDVQGRTLARKDILGAKEVIFSAENSLASGVYFVEMRGAERVYRGKVVVE